MGTQLNASEHAADSKYAKADQKDTGAYTVGFTVTYLLVNLK